MFEIPPYAFWPLLVGLVATGAWYFARVSRDAWAKRIAAKRASRLSDAEREILHHATSAELPNRGLVLRIPCQYTGPWIRAGGHDFFDKSDVSFQAKYVSAFDVLVSRGHFGHEGGRVYRMRDSGYEATKNDT